MCSSDLGVALRNQAIATIRECLFRKCLDGLRITASDPETSLIDVLDCHFDRNAVGIKLESADSEGVSPELEALLFLLHVVMSPLSATDILERGFALHIMDCRFDSLAADIVNDMDLPPESSHAWSGSWIPWIEACTLSTDPIGDWDGTDNTIR